MVAIEFSDVYLKLNEKKIINGLTGTMTQGKTTALIGPSGSGKTSILKLCNGLFTPTSGSIFIFGKEQMTYKMTELRQNVGIALQQAPMIQGTVKDNLLLPSKIKEVKVEVSKLVDTLKAVDLDSDYINKPIKDLSGGETQRVSIARLLLQEADILLLDEVTANLDDSSMRIVEETLKKYQRNQNKTLIWVTHNINQAKRVADEVWFLRQGQLIKSGSIELLQRMSESEITEWMGEINQ